MSPYEYQFVGSYHYCTSLPVKKIGSDVMFLGDRSSLKLNTAIIANIHRARAALDPCLPANKGPGQHRLGGN
jgi:hypothetical protein